MRAFEAIRHRYPGPEPPVTVHGMAIDVARTARGAFAGAVAAGVWALSQPLDRRVFGVPYDDTELLGKAVTRRAGWPVVGVVLHVANGAVFGAGYAQISDRGPLPPWARGPALALAEHLASWPLTLVTDRFHPAREELPRLAGSPAAFAQAAWRHLLFGVLLGEFERRLNGEPERPGFVHHVSTNGHGDLAQAVGTMGRGGP